MRLVYVGLKLAGSMRTNITGGRRKLRKEELHDLISYLLKEAKGNAYGIWWGNLKEREHLKN